MRAISLLVWICLLTFGYVQAQTFIHPGILHTQPDFDRMRLKVNANAQPWKGSWDKLIASPQAQLSWPQRATATIIRGGSGDNVALLYNDVAAAYQHALIWKITGNTNHGNKAVEILNAWSATHTLLSGNADRYLASGLFGYQFANAAEMMRGYPGFDLTRFQNYMLNVYYYPLVERFLYGNAYGSDHNDACISNYRANWDLCNMAAMVAIGVLCDNRTIYNRGIAYFKTGAGNGSITHAAPYVHSATLAQWEESGRDQPHTILGISLMSTVCQIAWNQGIDLFSWDDSRFRKAAEYVASYNIGNNVPYTPYCRGAGQNCNNVCESVISTSSRGSLSNVWELIYNHYAIRAGQAHLIPNIAAYAAQVRPEGGPGGHASTFDYPSFGSLTHSQDPMLQSAPANGIYKIIARHSGKAMEVANNGTGNGSHVRQWPSNDCVCQQWILTHVGNNQYTIVGVGSGKNLDVSSNATADGTHIHIWQPTGGNNQRFTFTATNNGYYRITPVHGGKALAVSESSTAEGANIQQWTYNGSNNQQWGFVSLNSSSSTRSTTTDREINDDFLATELAAVSVHPNPSVNEITITLPSSYREGEKIVDLHNEAGKIAISETFNDITHTLDIGTLSPGLYVLKVRGDKQLLVKKVIKK